MPQSILIVDDEAGIRDSLSSILTEEGYAVESVGSGEECLSRLAKQHVDLVLLDVWLPKMDGIETLERMRRDGHFPMVVMISGHGNIETAVRATKLGAFDFVEKPLSLEKTTQSVKRALEFLRLEMENRQLREELGQRYQVLGDEGSAPADRARCTDERTRAYLWRKRHWQRTRRTCAACSKSSQPRAFCGGQLRGDSRRVDRVRAIWPREGQLHWR
jgi:FixJ family two-component response regulator